MHSKLYIFLRAFSILPDENSLKIYRKITLRILAKCYLCFLRPMVYTGISIPFLKVNRTSSLLWTVTKSTRAYHAPSSK